jgi:hypothetical protein
MPPALTKKVGPCQVLSFAVANAETPDLRAGKCAITPFVWANPNVGLVRTCKEELARYEERHYERWDPMYNRRDDRNPKHLDGDEGRKLSTGLHVVTSKGGASPNPYVNVKPVNGFCTEFNGKGLCRGGLCRGTGGGGGRSYDHCTLDDIRYAVRGVRGNRLCSLWHVG